MKKHLVVLGGGIKGTATAAVASMFGDFQVTLLEREQIGSGATTTNHGRLHLGTAGWHKDFPELIQRRRAASELVRQLPDTVETRRNAIYCFEKETDADDFKRGMKANNVPYRVTNDPQLSHEWIEPPRYQQIIEVPEHSFNPASLAGRFAQTCINAGGRVMVKQQVKRIDRHADKHVIELTNGSQLDADVVVNTMARWCTTVDLPPEAPRPEIKWYRWRLLCLHSEALPGYEQLNQVVVIVDCERQMPSAIPHSKWITLDYNTVPVEEVPSPDYEDGSEWRKFDQSDVVDQSIWANVSGAFYPLVTLGPEERRGRLFSLAGIQGRRINATAGSQNHIESADKFAHYFVAFGGQASTGLLDSIEICNHLYSRYSMTGVNHSDVIRGLESSIAPTPISDYLPMRWEQHQFTKSN